MKVFYNSTNFTLVGGNYYSTAFKVENSDSLITIQATLTENGSITVQSSIDESD